MDVYLRKHPELGLWRDDVMQDFMRWGVTVREDNSAEMKWSPDAYNSEDQAKNTQSLMEEASKITVPVLLMYGTRGIAQEENYRPYAKALKQSQLIVVEGAGHNIYMEDPDIVIDAVRAFLKATNLPAHQDSRTPMHAGRLLANGTTTK